MVVGFCYLKNRRCTYKILRHSVMKLWAKPRCRNKSNEGRMDLLYLIKRPFPFFFNTKIYLTVLLNKMGFQSNSVQMDGNIFCCYRTFYQKD